MTDEAHISEIDPRDEIYLRFQEILLENINTGRLGVHPHAEPDYRAMRQSLGALAVIDTFTQPDSGPILYAENQESHPSIPLYEEDLQHLNRVLSILREEVTLRNYINGNSDSQRTVEGLSRALSNCFWFSQGIRGCAYLLLQHPEKIQQMIDYIAPGSDIDRRFIEMSLFNSVLVTEVTRLETINLRRKSSANPNEDLIFRSPSFKMMDAEHTMHLLLESYRQLL